MDSMLHGLAVFSAIGYLGVALQFTARLKKKSLFVLPGIVVMSFWSYLGETTTQFDMFMVSAWYGSLMFLLRASGLLGSWSGLFGIWALTLLPIACLLLSAIVGPALFLYPALVLHIILLLVAEQVMRLMQGTLRAMSIALGTLVLFQVYFYAYTIIDGSVSDALLDARVMLNAVIMLLLLVTPTYIKNDSGSLRQVGLSRSMAFMTTSLLIAGSIITAIAVLNLFLNSRVGAYSDTFEAFFLFLALLLVGFNLGSSTRRARVSVWVNRHFFETKHDHSSQWRTLSSRLATADADNYKTVALSATMAIYNAFQGVLFVRNNRRIVPDAMVGLVREPLAFDEADHPLFTELAVTGWVFVKGPAKADATDSFELVPPELVDRGDIQIILPLVREHELIGLLSFTPDLMHVSNFDFEDFDLLKTVAKQISHFIAFHQLALEKSVKQQFEAYHQFTTFVMHDLKNLVAQQDLVVKNASRFKDNPEFIADAFTTIENSVARMNRLMSKIQEHSVVEYEDGLNQPVVFSNVLEEVMGKVSHRNPVPVIGQFDKTLRVAADKESLIMAMTHIVTNAQDACKEDDCVSIEVRRTDDDRLVCTVADTGHGMDQQFIESRLFKPFDSTKKTVGMGIGAYQSREIISRLGGHISVDSTVGEGSCFTISLPVVMG
ncbi:MAG: putative PEP-CTERM system histidine kinase [Candidatus Azotimanducaceae bacterium]|jgi:putative PEP-CTERM system histidine kinase